MLQSSLESPRRGEHGEYKNVGKACMAGRVVGRIGFLGGGVEVWTRRSPFWGSELEPWDAVPAWRVRETSTTLDLSPARPPPLVELFPPSSNFPLSHPPTALQLLPESTACELLPAAPATTAAPRLAQTSRDISQGQLQKSIILIRYNPVRLACMYVRRAPLLWAPAHNTRTAREP